MADLQTTPAQISDKELIGYLESMGLLEKLTAKEKETFLQIAKAFNLNPFKREIYATKYGDTMSIIVGYETYLKRAERVERLNGWECETYGSIEGGDLKAEVIINRKDWAHPFKWTVYYEECVQKTKDNVPNKFWREKPRFMTKKVAIAQAFRLCFSDELGGMPYTQDELPDLVEAQHTELPNDKTTNGHTPKPLPVNWSEDLDTCTTLKELQTVWAKIPKADKPTFEAKKNEVKARFKNENEVTAN